MESYNYSFLFVVVIAYILVFFRPLSVNSARAFLIISTIYEITVLAFLVLEKRKFKYQFRETFIEEKPSILHTMNTSFQTRAIQEKQLKVNRIFQCIFVMNISKWIVNTIIMGQKTDSKFIQRQFYGKKVLGYNRIYDISRQRILQISNIIRNVRALPKYKHSRLIFLLIKLLIIPFTILFYFISVYML